MQAREAATKKEKQGGVAHEQKTNGSETRRIWIKWPAAKTDPQHNARGTGKKTLLGQSGTESWGERGNVVSKEKMRTLSASPKKKHEEATVGIKRTRVVQEACRREHKNGGTT